jgi:putative PIN family toxin of toxin-antitoxin system
MNVVVDTNVFVSSFFGGNPKVVVDLWKSGRLTLCLSSAIVDEYMRVLRGIPHKNDDQMEKLLHLFAVGSNTLFAAKTLSLKIVADDPDDDKFIECAVALHAEYIVTGDKALLGVKKYMGIRILTPRQFLDEIDVS